MFSTIPASPGPDRPMITPAEITACLQQQVREILADIQAEKNPVAAARAYKQILKVKADLPPAHYETVLLQLCRTLNRLQFYGEILYYYMTAPYYLGSTLNAGNLLDASALKDAAFTEVVKALSVNKQKINVLLYNSNLGRLQNIKDTVTTVCSQNCYLFTDPCGLLNQDQAFIGNYQLLLIVNNSGSHTIDCLNKFRKKFDTGILINLHCYSLAEATRFFHEYGQGIEYITYNDKMLYGMIYTALRLRLL